MVECVRNRRAQRSVAAGANTAAGVTGKNVRKIWTYVWRNAIDVQQETPAGMLAANTAER